MKKIMKYQEIEIGKNLFLSSNLKFEYNVHINSIKGIFT